MQMILKGHSFRYEMTAMVTMFTGNPPKFVEDEDDWGDCYIEIKQETVGDSLHLSAELLQDGERTRREKTVATSAEGDIELELAKLVYTLLSARYGITPPWGVLTGVRPVKLFHKMAEQGHTDKEIEQHFMENYLLQPDKAALATTTRQHEWELLQMADADDFSLFVSIPFCPSRCNYCSFVSHSIERTFKLIDPYVDCMVQELAEVGCAAAACGLKLKTIYIGGGTPTILSVAQFTKILEAVRTNFAMETVVEYTVEAGRPDTFTREKLELLKAYGVDRISINPQTFNDDVLVEIGRNHTVADVLAAYELAAEVGFKTVNMDFIAGLPTDSFEGFVHSIQTAIAIVPQNITVHTLSYKRSAENKEGKALGPQAEAAVRMLSYAHTALQGAGYLPYYLYRQKNMLANLENTGYTLPGHAGLYNALMMDDRHTVLAVGAGSVTKLFDRDGRLERVFNFKYPYEYLDEFEQIMKRKKNIYNFFGANDSKSAL